MSLSLLLSDASVAGIDLSGAQTARYNFSGTRVNEKHSGLPYNSGDAFIDIKATVTVTCFGQAPSGAKPGVKGATSLTPASAGANGGFTWTGGTAISLGTMAIDSVEGSLDQEGNPTFTITATSVGAPVFAS